jgi:5-methylthioadenosine/S-adenosylhomocysteine deaminase
LSGLFIRGVALGAQSTSIRLDGDTIAAIDPHLEPAPGDEVIDGDGLAAVEGLVNGHTHAAMTLFRGYGDDLPLMEWLRTRIWPAEARLDADAVYWGTRLACLEMIRTGTVRFLDMYFHSEAVARAVVDSGLRAVVSAVFFDFGDEAKAAEMRAQVVDGLDALAAAGPLITPCLGPHAVYTVSEASLGWLGELAHERDLPVQIHLAETADEVADCVAETGARPLALIDRAGLLGPRTVLAHGCWLDDAELDVVAERGATIVTNPASNMKLATGRAFPYPAAAARGIPMGLGTDGAASNNGLDLLQEAKLFALLQKHEAGDAAVLPAGDCWEIATGQRSPLLGGHRLEVGAPADLVLVRAEAPELVPGDLTANLVYSASGAVVDTVVVAGEVLMQARLVTGGDEVVRQAVEQAGRMTGS